MRTLFIASDLGVIGGIQKYNREFLYALRAFEEDVVVLELKSDTLFSKAFFVIKTFFYSLKYRPDYIFLSHINFSFIGYFLNKAFRIPYVLMTHGIDVWNVRSFLQKKALKNASFITTVSEYTRERIIVQFFELKERIIYLPNSVREEEFFIKSAEEDFLQRYKIKNKRIILTVARLSAEERYKGYDIMLAALPRIINKFPDVMYVIVGYGNDFSRVKKFIQEKKLTDHVILTGAVSGEDLLNFYNACEVFVMPSKGEGFGIVFLEALACGRPVIAGNQDASREAVLGGELGILVNPDNSGEVGNAVVSVLNKEMPHLKDPELLRRRVIENYGFDRFQDRIKDFLNKINQ